MQGYSFMFKFILIGHGMFCFTVAFLQFFHAVVSRSRIDPTKDFQRRNLPSGNRRRNTVVTSEKDQRNLM